MTIKIGINGFGRIGRMICRAVMDRNDIKLVAINDPFNSGEQLAYSLKYDSVHGIINKDIKGTEEYLYIDNNKIQLIKEKNPININWEETEVDYVCECSGVFRTTETAKYHIKPYNMIGAKKVVISAPPKDDTPMFVMGANNETYSKDLNIVSNASCTTNCLAPLMKVLDECFGVEEALMTTIHATTANQLTVDGAPRGGKDMRAGRAASVNIIPASTGAAKAVGKVLPQLEGKITGMALRVPVPDVSIVDVSVKLRQKTNMDEIIKMIKKYSENKMKGILSYTDMPLVSQDFINNSHSSILDINAGIQLNETFFKLLAWYDNEWGYSNRMVDLILHMNKIDNS
jgi:glyceraldehyde 3-phosphate dehydrogenase